MTSAGQAATLRAPNCSHEDLDIRLFSYNSSPTYFVMNIIVNFYYVFQSFIDYIHVKYSIEDITAYYL